MIVHPKKTPKTLTVPTRQLHWGKLNDSKIKGTIWESEIDDSQAKIDVKELEKLFCVSASGKTQAQASRRGSTMPIVSKAVPLNLIEPKLANNIGIAISRFKGSLDDITSALSKGHKQAFSVDQLTGLLAAIPAPDEIDAVVSYDGPIGNLNRAELFLKKLNSVPRYTARIRCMLYRATFDERVVELTATISAVDRAASQIRDSALLKHILEIILSIGNYLNGTSARGSAWGFDLGSLEKLGGVKSSDAKTNLLHYVANTLIASVRVEGAPLQDRIAVLNQELSHVQAAARNSWQDTRSELRQLGQGLKQIEAQVQADAVLEFKSAFEDFTASASDVMSKLDKSFSDADSKCSTLKDWFGEDRKCQPEDIFSAISSFLSALKKAHRENQEREEALKRQARLVSQAASMHAALSGSKAKKPPGKNSNNTASIDLAAELADKLARRVRAFTSDAMDSEDGGLVDSVVQGMASGSLMADRRNISFVRRRSIRRGGRAKIAAESPSISEIDT